MPAHDFMYAPDKASKYGVDLDYDLQRWNWRWMMHGEIRDVALDEAIKMHFNDVQRLVMTWTPERAVQWVTTTMPHRVTPHVVARMAEAQARLFPPTVAGRDGNVIAVNFKTARR